MRPDASFLCTIPPARPYGWVYDIPYDEAIEKMEPLFSIMERRRNAYFDNIAYDSSPAAHQDAFDLITPAQWIGPRGSRYERSIEDYFDSTILYAHLTGTEPPEQRVVQDIHPNMLPFFDSLLSETYDPELYRRPGPLTDDQLFLNGCSICRHPIYPGSFPLFDKLGPMAFPSIYTETPRYSLREGLTLFDCEFPSLAGVNELSAVSHFVIYRPTHREVFVNSPGSLGVKCFGSGIPYKRFIDILPMSAAKSPSVLVLSPYGDFPIFGNDTAVFSRQPISQITFHDMFTIGVTLFQFLPPSYRRALGYLSRIRGMTPSIGNYIDEKLFARDRISDTTRMVSCNTATIRVLLAHYLAHTGKQDLFPLVRSF